MNDKQIIAQCSDKGKFKVDSEIFEDENWEFTHGLFSTSNMEDWYMLNIVYKEEMNVKRLIYIQQFLKRSFPMVI